MTELKIYKNSRNYIPIDVAKGIDMTTGERVSADTEDPNYERLPKCAYCKNFSIREDKIGLGTCKINDKQFLCYPDLVAVTCNGYEEAR